MNITEKAIIENPSEEFINAMNEFMFDIYIKYEKSKKEKEK